MKPKSDYQRRIVELSQKLPAITEKQKQWAIDHCFNKEGFYSKGKVWCQVCGEEFEKVASPLGIDVVGDETVCPKCGNKIKLVNCKKSKNQGRFYYTILTTFKGYQVCRHFIIEKQIYKVSKYIHLCQEPMYSINEAVQNWIAPDGKETIIARPTKYMPGYYDVWNFEKPMAIRTCNPYYRGKYEINAYRTYPHRRILPIIKRNGYDGRFNRLPASGIFKLLLGDREAEILAKNRQYELLVYKWKMDRREFCMPYWHSIRIAIKNKYIVSDASLWFDYLDLLAYFNLDTHNAHYVCPQNLKAEHDRLLKRKERAETKRKAEEQRKEAALFEERYQKSKGKFFGLCFGNENIVITVITSVAEMAEEGTDMHHCVYSMKYFNKEDSLILSAKDKDGNRLETIEINLKTFEIIQSRGKCNSNSLYHDTILKLVNENINLIKKAA